MGPRLKWLGLGLGSLDAPGLWFTYVTQVPSLLVLSLKRAQPSWVDLQVSLCGAVPFSRDTIDPL